MLESNKAMRGRINNFLFEDIIDLKFKTKVHNCILVNQEVNTGLPFLNTELVETALGMKQDIVWDTKRRPKAVLQDRYINMILIR